jgi:L-ascorbate metabolism protein UlaG (beta-lactamase superfamily)
MQYARLAIAAGAIALLCIVGAAAPSDSIPATGGAITVTPINHATLQIAHGAQVILVDPTPQGTYTGLAAPTLILITDIHADHFDPATIEKVKKADTKIVAPAAAAEKIPGAIVMANGDSKTIDGIAIQAMPMYNLTRGPAPGQLYHPKGRGNGYLLTIGGKRVYLSGDTEGIPEMRALKNVDVAFVSMNLPYTMPVSEAAEAVKAFKPKIVYPYHYRGQDVNEFASALKGTGIDVRLRDWYGPEGK